MVKHSIISVIYYYLQKNCVACLVEFCVNNWTIGGLNPGSATQLLLGP